jgi:superfamily II DNA or RNA helicase
MEYQEFIKSKQFDHISDGYQGFPEFPDAMFSFQRDCCHWALKRGKAALFVDTGLGKTIMQLTWANNIAEYTHRPVLIVAPLCVAQQTVREGEKFGIQSEYIRQDEGILNIPSIYVTNYEMLKNFKPESFAGIVLDESSILKGMNGSIRKMITEFAKPIDFRLSCTATPSPNDYMELGTQSEFLGIMSQVEMLAMFFIHDGSDTSKWRLKGHGKNKFWEWLSTWSIVLRHPADLGYESDGYDLPPVNYVEHIVETEATDDLFVSVAQGLSDRNKARRETVNERVKKAIEIANGYDEPVIIWCHLNDESKMLSEGINNCVEVTGSDAPDKKENNLLAFTDGKILKLASKPKIAGFGMNWQHCSKIVFVGLSDSWESYYQAIRRCWRFGQENEVTVHIVSSDREGAVLDNIRRKEWQNKEMGENMARLMRKFTIADIKGAEVEKTDYLPSIEMKLPSFLGA